MDQNGEHPADRQGVRSDSPCHSQSARPKEPVGDPAGAGFPTAVGTAIREALLLEEEGLNKIIARHSNLSLRSVKISGTNLRPSSPTAGCE